MTGYKGPSLPLISHTGKRIMFIVLLTGILLCSGLNFTPRVHNKRVYMRKNIWKELKTMNNNDNYIFGIDGAIQTIAST